MSDEKQQPDLFATDARGEAKVRERRELPHFQRHSATSRAAAVSMYEHAPRQEGAVARFIEQRGQHGATDDEIEVALSLRHQAASARRVALRDRGVIKDSGVTRKTRSGRQATVWVWTGGAR